MVIEMRTYRTKAGMRTQFLEVFCSRSIPEHARLGMPIIGPFLSLEDPDVFFFMRGFPDLSSRDRLKASFYEGELWKQELEAVLMPLIDRYDVVLVEDREGWVQWR
jgi:NIPSNAP